MIDTILRTISKGAFALAALAFLWPVCGTSPAGAQTFTNFDVTDFGSGGIELVSKTAQTVMKDNKFVSMILKGNVLVTMKSGNGTLKGDILVFMSATPTSPTLLRVFGNPVKIEQKGLDAVCKQFSHFPDQKKIVLLGDAVTKIVVDGKLNTLAGQKITIVQAPDGSVMTSIEGPVKLELSQGFSGMTLPKTTGPEKSPAKGETGSGRKDNKPAVEDGKTSGTAPLEKATDKPADEKP